MQNYVSQLPEILTAEYFTNPELALKCLQSTKIDLLFLDIEMPDINGLDFCRSLVDPPMVIFTTAYRQHAVEGFELEALDYLVKPFDFVRFKRGVEKAMEYLQFLRQSTTAMDDFLFINSAYRITKIRIGDIYAAETFGDYLKLYLDSKPKPVITLMSLKRLLNLLPKEGFMRVHRSFLVAESAITGRHGKRLLVRKMEIPIGRTYFAEVKKRFGP